MHTAPDTLALMALGEEAGTPEDALHLVECPVCRAQIEELAHVVHLGRQPDVSGELLTPPAALWGRIQAEVNAGRLPMALPRSAPPQRLVRRSMVALAAAAALVVGAAAGLGFDRLQPAETANPSVHLNALPRFAGSEGEAKIITNAEGVKELVVNISPVRPVEGHFDVWLGDEKALHMQRMGSMTGNTGTFPVPASMNLHNSPVVDISLEPENDPDVARHSDVSVVRGRLRV